MEKKLREKWARALEGGKYAQGRAGLRVGDRFCCLGVLCDLVEPEGWSGGRHDGLAGYPSKRFMNKVGLSLEDMHRLADMNDKVFLFDEIAKEVRKLG